MKKIASYLVSGALLMSHQAAFSYNSSYYVQPPSTFEKIFEQTTIVLGCTFAAGLTYLIARSACTRSMHSAQEFFQDQLSLVGNRYYFDEATFITSLKASIIATSDRYFRSWWRLGAYEEFKNYPFVFFRMHLKGHIDTLKFLQVFRLGLDSHQEVAQLINRLEELLRLIDCDYDYIKERRRFDERAAPAVVIHTQSVPAQTSTNQINLNLTIGR